MKGVQNRILKRSLEELLGRCGKGSCEGLRDRMINIELKTNLAYKIYS